MKMDAWSFLSIYRHGMVRVAVAAPRLKVADPAFNVGHIIDMVERADKSDAALVLFPELALSSYAIDDLLQQSALHAAVESSIGQLLKRLRDLQLLVLVGAPLIVEDRLYNVAIVAHRGRILGVVPKVYLPNYREFYERRHFASGADATCTEVEIAGSRVPFGIDLLFAADDVPKFVVHAEVCEDVWVPIPPSTHAALAGATVLANLSASNVTLGKSEYRHVLCKAHSGRCLAAYLYSAAGPGESTTDLAWDGNSMIYENSVLLAEAPRFSTEGQIIFADLDLELLAQERLRQNTFSDCAAIYRPSRTFRRVEFTLDPPRDRDIGLKRNVSRFPFVPSDARRLSELCFEAYNIQVHGLKQRLESTGLSKVVIGVSGGLDSAQVLLVAANTFDALKLPRTNILACTLPAFATSERTKRNAWRLMNALGVNAAEIDMTDHCRQVLADIDHPFAGGTERYDVTFENVQAGARAATLFRLANQHDAIVLGTGDLSELALGWCTYGVGDHMSHYNVNGSVPKTLIQHLIRWVAEEGLFGADATVTLRDVLETEISPELVPGGSSDTPAQKTEEIIGPYELQDFNLYYITRFGFRPSKVAFLAYSAWRDAAVGEWPPNISVDKRRAYSLADIEKWLAVFLNRFFGNSQFKRSALPNSPKVSSGGSLSPRGDWRAPSDSSAAVWLSELRRTMDSMMRVELK
jgi:NAD+ synthase (glutamine-hydrolysing)